MKEISNEEFQENFINQSSEQLSHPISKDTDQTDVVKYPLTPPILEEKYVDTDKISTKDILETTNAVWKAEHKVRLYITIVLITLFVVSVIIGFIMLMVAKDSSLLIGPPVLLVPILYVLRFWFYRPNENKAKGSGDQKN